MRIELELPELPEFPDGFPDYWLNILFTNNRQTSYQVRAMTTTYVRLVEAAMTEYRQARSLVHAVWSNGGTKGWLGIHNRACAYFESCLTNMHRAVRFMMKILSRPDVPRALKDLFPNKPLFTRSHIADRICNVRDAIHHLTR
jgi:hypothetical protein